MEIREIAIDHYGPLRDARHRPRPGLQIFFGPNESGKTLLIDAILKLMLGSRIKDFAGLDRVPEMPRGRIALAADGREHILDGDTLLDKVVALDNSHLRNIFVIRNKDLNISDQAGYLPGQRRADGHGNLAHRPPQGCRAKWAASPTPLLRPGCPKRRL